MKRIGVVDAEATFARPAKDRRRGRCFLWPRQREQKVHVSCSKCGNFVCGGHSQKTCLLQLFGRWRLTIPLEAMCTSCLTMTR